MVFKDRHEAGIQLVEKLQNYKGNKDALILAIPRGGLVIGYELAKGLQLPLDIVVTKKIGYPGDPEYAIGAVSYDDIILNEEVVERGDISQSYIDEETERLRKMIKERYEQYRGKQSLPQVKDKVVIITDDGVATGHTMLISIKLIKKQGPKKIIVAIPVAPPSTVTMLGQHVDKVVCLDMPESFMAIGQFYLEFTQVSDEEAIAYLKKANA